MNVLPELFIFIFDHDDHIFITDRKGFMDHPIYRNLYSLPWQRPFCNNDYFASFILHYKISDNEKAEDFSNFSRYLDGLAAIIARVFENFLYRSRKQAAASNEQQTYRYDKSGYSKI